jgi:cytochrome c-type biogenesis protein CcmH/NrfG
MAKTNPPAGNPITPAARQAAQQCFVRGVEVCKKQDWDYAIKLFKDACKLAPDQLVYRQQLRQAAKRKFDNNKRGSRFAAVTTVGARAGLHGAKAKKEFLRALECCEDCLSENPWDPGVLLDLAAICEGLGWMEMAIWSAESALERDVADATVNRALAQLYERHGAFTKAMDAWDRVKKAKPADEEADKKLKDLAASATIDRGGYDGAKSFTRAVADKAKTQEMLDEAKGGTSEMRHSGQVAELEQKIKAKPTEIGPYLQLSQIYRRMGKLEQARALMAKARDATGGHPDALTELADIEMEQIRTELAIAEKLLADKPNDAEAQKIAAEKARTLNEFELREFQRRVERLPTDMGLRADLGIRLAKAGLHDQAIGELQKAKAAPGRKVDATIWLGHCFLAKKNARLAERNFEEALAALSPGDQKNFLDLHYWLGRSCEELAKKSDAINHYDEVAAIEYSYRDVAQRLDKLSSSET